MEVSVNPKTIDAIVQFAESHGFTHDVEQMPTGTGDLEDEIDDYMNDKYPVEGAYWGRSEQGDWGLWEIDDYEQHKFN